VLIWLIVYALVAFRLSELVVIDDGPFDIFFNLRGWANKPPTETIIRGALAGLLSCVHCVGLWLSLAFGLVYYFSNAATVTDSLLFAFAVAGLQSILAHKLGRS